jgi:hypothetical protein
MALEANTENSDSLITLMTKPNITIRSNVFVRNGAELQSDRAFIAQVRGRSALLRFLKQIEPNGDLATTAHKYLTRAQLAEVAWQAACSICGAFPEGPVTCDGTLEVQFRCPRGTCRASEFLPRTVLLNLDLVRRCSDVFRNPIGEIVQDALKVQRPVAVEESQQSVVRVPVVVRLTLAQRYFLTDRDIEAALWHLLQLRESL